ncbi:MAG TPA: 30S ribosomal protein S24e [Candidatus Diapherotrites archaeon]|uniref:Small ribosomal subunit protein eS24 n=1 Tax=Candidatus Iainarchaeum sp. TaxID=3101447 RepID=A0A7J4IYA2_9ARCH|nr:30S ribosomal protein S24e [Candidatus Diapherotrites archaeon]
MRIDIVKKQENVLLGRQEIEFAVKEVNATPSRKELRQKLAALINADEKNMVVDVFATKYGTSEFGGVCRVYKNDKDLKRTELEYVVHRNFGRPQKPKAAEGQEEPKPAAKK